MTNTNYINDKYDVKLMSKDVETQAILAKIQSDAKKIDKIGEPSETRHSIVYAERDFGRIILLINMRSHSAKWIII
jgi:hypothetical protein